MSIKQQQGNIISTTLKPKWKHCPIAVSDHARPTKLPRDTSGIHTNRFPLSSGDSKIILIYVHFVHSMN